jgi:hypothetical protein
MTAIRATLRPIRQELFGIGGLALLLVVAAAFVGGRLLAFDLPQACLDEFSADPACVGRQYDAFAYRSFLDMWVPIVTTSAAFLPPLAGLILGLAVVGKELDQRTTVLAWSLSPSRRRWLLQRIVPVGLGVVLLGLLVTLIVEALARLTGATFEPSFETMSKLGLAPAAQGLVAFGIAIVIGAMLGRLLPALLVAAAFVIFGSLLVSQVGTRLLDNESIIADQLVAGPGMYFDSLIRTPDGQIISWDVAYRQYANQTTGELDPSLTQLVRYAPIELYPVAVARYLVIELALAALLLTFGLAVVERRAP